MVTPTERGVNSRELVTAESLMPADRGLCPLCSDVSGWESVGEGEARDPGPCRSQLSPLRLVRRRQVARLASLSQLLYHQGARSRALNRGRGRQDVSGSQGPCLCWYTGRGGQPETGSRCARLRGCAGGLLPPGLGERLALWGLPSTSPRSLYS